MNDSQKNNLSFIYGMGVNVTGSVFGRAAHFISQLLAARVLGPFSYGIYAIGWNYIRTIGTIATLGLDSGVIHYGTQLRGKDQKKLSEVILGSLMFTFFSGLMLGIFTYIFSRNISLLINKPGLEIPLRWFGLALPLLAGTKVAASATRITLKMVVANLVEQVIQPGINLLIIGFLLLINSSLELYVVAAVVSFGGSFVAGLIYLKNLFLKGSSNINSILRAGKDVLLYSIPISVPVMFGTIMLMMDRIFVGYFLSESAAGIYQTIALTSAVFISLLSAVKTIVAPMSADFFHQQQLKELEQLVHTSTRWVLNICLPVILMILISPGIFLEVFFGDSYRSGAFVLVIIVFGQLMNLSKGAIDQVLIMTNNQKSWMIATMIVFASTTVFYVILIPLLGILGAAFVNFGLYSGLFLGAGVLLYKKLKIRMFGSGTVKSFASAFITGGVMLLIKRLFPVPNIWTLIQQAILSWTIFLASLYLLGLSDEDRRIIRAIKVKTCQWVGFSGGGK